MQKFRQLTAATLAVGTEITDGQVLDRNSAWLSVKLVHAGIKVIEHRAVADDRADISRSLIELSSRADLLFVTGGLGPTSDDFTRELVSEVFAAPLAYDDSSWIHIEERFKKLGRTPREIQKQQCYFPKGARVLKNHAGTANAFSMRVKNPLNHKSDVQVFVLPGPPLEIAAIWDTHLEKEIEALTPLAEREELKIFRTLGAGESEVAERVEPLLKGHVIRVGYRANMPYVEVKLWYKNTPEALAVVQTVKEALTQWFSGEEQVY